MFGRSVFQVSEANAPSAAIGGCYMFPGGKPGSGPPVASRSACPARAKPNGWTGAEARAVRGGTSLAERVPAEDHRSGSRPPRRHRSAVPDPTRIKVRWAPLQGGSPVACLADLAGAVHTARMAKFGLAGLVEGRREGTFACHLTYVARGRPPATPRASRRDVRLRLRVRREGTFVWYSAAEEHVRRLLRQSLFHPDRPKAVRSTDRVADWPRESRGDGKPPGDSATYVQRALRHSGALSGRLAGRMCHTGRSRSR